MKMGRPLCGRPGHRTRSPGRKPRAPRSFFKEAASQGFLEAVSFYYSPRKLMFRVVISASSSSLRSLPAPVSFFGFALRSSPQSASLFPCPPVLAHPMSAFLSDHSVYFWELVLTIGHKRGNFSPYPEIRGILGIGEEIWGCMPIRPGKSGKKTGFPEEIGHTGKKDMFMPNSPD